MKKIFAVILLIGAMNFISGCMMMHDGLHGQEHHEEEGLESTRGNAPRNNHSH